MVNTLTYNRVIELMTPKEILAKKDFDKPLIIHPERISRFDELLTVRHEVRDLMLVPVKDDAMYLHYKTIDKEILLQEITSKFSPAIKVFTTHNKFPYWLPTDLEQRLVWIAPDTMDEEVVTHILALAYAEGITENEIILFERPANITTTLVRGTFPQVRHVHLWTKKKI